MRAERGDLEARVDGSEVWIGNDRVRARFYLQDGGYVQEFLAADRKEQFHLVLSSIHRNMIPSSEHRACASPMIAGDRPHLFGLTRDALRMAYSQARVTRHDERQVAVELAGSALGHSLKCTVAVEPGSNAIHVVIEDQIERGWSDPLVEYFMTSYAFVHDGQTLCVGQDPDYTWAPSLRPTDDHVIGDASFHSPAAVVQMRQFAAALVPDLVLLGKDRTMPTCLDLDLSNGLLPAPLLSFGFCGYEQVHGDNYSRHDLTHAQRIDGGRMRFGCHVIVSAEAKREPVRRQVAQFMWERYRSANRHSTSVRPLPGERTGGQPVGALGTPDARAAYGLYALGVGTHDKGLTWRARSLVDTVLSAPQDRGLFPTRYDAQRREWSGCRIDIGGAEYHTAECSAQLYWLLQWHQSVQEDARILDYARIYADFLLETQQANGAVPSWYDLGHEPLSLPRLGIQTAPSTAFLCKLARVTGEKVYAQAAEQSARFVLKEIVPRRLFLDGSLMNTEDRCALDCPDPHTGMRPMSGMAMLWIALICVELGEDLTPNPSPSFDGLRMRRGESIGLGSSSRRREYLAAGRGMLDELCLLQSIWSKPWAPEHLEYGQLAQGNLGARYDAELTAEFARCAMRYASLTGQHEYFERGAAALRAVIRKPGLSALTQARVAASVAEAESRFGAVYVHVAGKWAVALDGWRIGAVDIASGAVSLLVEGGPPSIRGRIVFGGIRGQTYKVSVNEQHGRWSREDMERGIEIPGAPPKRRTEKGQLALIG